MEVQEKNNETLAAYAQCFKTAAKQYTFDNDTVTICILGDFEMHPPSELKHMKRTLKLWLKSSDWLNNLNTAQQITATLTPSTVSMMSGNDRCLVFGQTGHFGNHYSDAQYYSCNEFGYFAQDCPNKIPPSEIPCHQDRSHSRHQYTHTKRDRYTPLIMVLDMGDISAGHSPTSIPTTTEASI